MAYIKCPRNPDRGTFYFERFCNDRTGRIKNSPRYVYCQGCPYYGENKAKESPDAGDTQAFQD